MFLCPIAGDFFFLMPMCLCVCCVLKYILLVTSGQPLVPSSGAPFISFETRVLIDLELSNQVRLAGPCAGDQTEVFMLARHVIYPHPRQSS